MALKQVSLRAPQAVDLVSVTSFFIDELPMTRNAADRRHWRALHNEKKRWFYLIRAAAGIIKAAEPCNVIITFRTLKYNDKDNLHARAKSPLDALQRCGIISNDDPQTIHLTVKQDLVKHRKDCGTLIEISEVSPLDAEELERSGSGRW